MASMANPNTYVRVADLLDRLADGDSVRLGEFSTQAETEASDADEDACTLRDLAEGLRKAS